MDLDFFADPGLAPKPREDIRIEALTLTPYPDGRRVRLEIEVTPFAPNDRPNLEITVSKPNGVQVTSVSIIEPVQRAFGLTVHLRGAQPEGQYEFRADLFYEEEPVQHSVTRTIAIPTSNPGTSPST